MKLRYIVTAIILSLLFGCSNKVCNCPVDQEIQYTNDSIINSWNNQDWWSEIGIETISQFEYDFYRLTIFPSWNNSTVTQYILENKKGNTLMSIKEYQQDQSTEKLTLKKKGGTKNLHMDSDKWTEINTLAESNCFWNMPVATGEQYLDGVSWLLEVKKRDVNICSKKQYHIVSRVARDSSFFSICNDILKLGNSSIKEQDSLLDISWRTD
ncbi:hypothetical protein [Flagellimonas sp.]|uniref:hypothetical protein n=1 Tax=Flagellimonas sp. TaxID=2058762 RepID=UPI003B5058D2